MDAIDRGYKIKNVSNAEIDCLIHSLDEVNKLIAQRHSFSVGFSNSETQIVDLMLRKLRDKKRKH